MSISMKILTISRPAGSAILTKLVRQGDSGDADSGEEECAKCCELHNCPLLDDGGCAKSWIFSESFATLEVVSEPEKLFEEIEVIGDAVV
jgi:hypothetical protein